ncbi:CDP-glucose 4,6-dehydratase [Shimia litoralis]|uniref:CDP-glucose 4,6-dehydratase n=1 Tax=Shimia litoralis TaxID=420403 RepID=A0A4U7MS29_9RHOB|nr:CDP-glucose 4,6-dehydratase [Shimia litoralis]TKZ15779.1 CDP-glucose 4,6-dehydratase [Shimia litoralis]
MSDFWSGKRVLVSGHTGFKGSWLSFWLNKLGADVAGLALSPDTNPALFDQMGIEALVDHMIGDIRDADLVARRVAEVQPDLVFHLAAQPLVIESYATPLETWQTNVMGSCHVMQAIRQLSGRCAVVMVTTDKVYENLEDGRPYNEQHSLGGHDPYSASKAAMEFAVSSWRRSFLGGTNIRMASARAGNVIGGGDWAANRIVPDIVRALSRGKPIEVRNPDAVRPWQHVLEPLAGYLVLAERLWTSDDPVYQSGFNFGPDPQDARPVRDVVTEALRHWPGRWNDVSPEDAVHEAGLLSLDPAKSEALLGVKPRWSFEQTIEKTINWYRSVGDGKSAAEVTEAQLSDFGGL